MLNVKLKFILAVSVVSEYRRRLASAQNSNQNSVEWSESRNLTSSTLSFSCQSLCSDNDKNRVEAFVHDAVLASSSWTRFVSAGLHKCIWQ